MGRCCKKYLNRMLDAYVEDLEDIKNRIVKDFTDMDFENATTRTEMQDVVYQMVAHCDNIKNNIENLKV